MAAGQYNINIEQGSTLDIPVVWKSSDGVPINLTGYTARMQIRRTKADPSILYELTTENGRLSIDGPQGKVTIRIPAADSAGFTWRRGVYDLEMVSGDAVTRLLEGAVTVSPEVTR